jgi:hypothetical protein
MNNDKWARISVLSELIGAVAVVLSLVYVAIEIRENTQAVQSATYQDLVANSDDFLLTLAQDSALTAIWLRGDENPSSLSDTEAQRYWWIVRTFWRNMEVAFRQHQVGMLGDPEYELYVSLTCTPKPPGRRLTWQSHSPTLSPDFVSFVESCVDMDPPQADRE